MTPLLTESPSVHPRTESGRPEARRLPLLDQYRKEQRTLTAVERFAQLHAEASAPAQERYYRDLLPTARPEKGQQYAFQVDLDQCTGCKACVTACHNLNGLEEGETWRSVGLLHGGSTAAPVQISVTTACHHCLDPACLTGCPVGAYEKSPTTGIVKHLDDQCIGCQYCTFTCPYDVPQFSVALGIVRKCDMCSDRLASGEAPACVQACPNEAIAITIVTAAQALEDAQGDAFLPGAPSPGITVPTTVYKTERALPRNLLPANFYAVKPAHHHTPLVVMLVLTQLSVGAFCVDALARGFVDAGTALSLGRVHALVAATVGLGALAASVFHLGRPLYAFRAIIGLRTSWMSREILIFGLFAPLAIAYAATSLGHAQLAGVLPEAVVTRIEDVLRGLLAITGVLGIACSVLIYHVTRRAFWNAPATGFKFFMTAAVLGLATTLVTFSAAKGLVHDASPGSPFGALVAGLSRILVAASVTKLVGELVVFRHLKDRRYTESKRSALLMTGDLARYTWARFGFLIVGGVLLPLFDWTGPVSTAVSAASLALLLAGELAERTLFFAAVSSPAMPGGLR